LTNGPSDTSSLVISLPIVRTCPLALGMLQPQGSLNIGSIVEAECEPGDGEFVEATIKAIDVGTGQLTLQFANSLVRSNVAFSEIRMPIAGQVTSSDDDLYVLEVAGDLPTAPTTEELTNDGEAKYAYVQRYKDVGNALFKAGKYAWAIRTYVDAVNSLSARCYKSREYMMFDYFARTPCGQCYSNAALCALKLGENERAAALCERAMECKPEDTDLVKVLLRHGQALLGLNRPEEAKVLLERAADKEPNNRAVREEMVRAKKAAAAASKEADKRLFQSVDLTKQGLTSKREEEAAALRQAVERGFEALVEGKDDDAIKLLEPLMRQHMKAAAAGGGGAIEAARNRRPSTILAAYGIGIAHYHCHRLEEAIEALRLFFALKAELDAEVIEYPPPLTGLPLARFYLAHALFNTQRLASCKEHLAGYFADVDAAGPQRILNMPSSMLGRHVSDTERAASRFKVRACANEAQADAHTMLAMIAEREAGPEAAVGHLLKACGLASSTQKVDAHANLARLYEMLGDEAKRDEQAALARTLREKVAAGEAEAARKKAEEAAKEKDADAAEELKDETEEAPADGAESEAVEPVLADPAH